MNIITYKTLMQELNMTRTTAQRYLKKMKDFYQPKSGKLTMQHFVDYFSPTQSPLEPNNTKNHS